MRSSSSELLLFFYSLISPMNKLAVFSFFDFFENDSSLHDFLSRASLNFLSLAFGKKLGGKALFFLLNYYRLLTTFLLRPLRVTNVTRMILGIYADY